MDLIFHSNNVKEQSFKRLQMLADFSAEQFGWEGPARLEQPVEAQSYVLRHKKIRVPDDYPWIVQNCVAAPAAYANPEPQL